MRKLNIPRTPHKKTFLGMKNRKLNIYILMFLHFYMYMFVEFEALFTLTKSTESMFYV